MLQKLQNHAARIVTNRNQSISRKTKFYYEAKSKDCDNNHVQ